MNAGNKIENPQPNEKVCITVATQKTGFRVPKTVLW